MSTRTLTEAQRGLILLALTNNARDDKARAVEFSTDNRPEYARLAVQFELQAAEAEALADLIENAEEVTLS